jgi:hypothetical protein
MRNTQQQVNGAWPDPMPQIPAAPGRRVQLAWTVQVSLQEGGEQVLFEPESGNAPIALRRGVTRSLMTVTAKKGLW